jgi:hypothetical protein
MGEEEFRGGDLLGESLFVVQFIASPDAKSLSPSTE